MFKKSFILIIALAILALLAVGAYYLSMPHGSGASEGGQPPLPTQTITIGSASVTAEIASTDAERHAGLSNRPSLEQGRGMLFVFEKDGNWGIWMPDMQFSIDIVWADASGRVVALDGNVSPQTYLTKPPTVFYPQNNARYVLELPAGFAAAHRIAVGSHMSLPQ